ncbi:MAG: hypothetical protein DRQ89_04905 [Epsilonproteobacteria bacterium]|nr:MAG: hypothetical protein DRQ89_04905 [Campylobacterota bacterium]
MGKISLYVLLILIYLGLSKSLKTDEKRFYYKNYESLDQSTSLLRPPTSLILLDSYSEGLILKTYLLKIRLIRVFSDNKDITIKTSHEFWKKNAPNIGMSILRLDEGHPKAEITPLPPGSYFIGSFTFGSWRLLNSGKRVWKFHRSYRDLPELLGWGKWQPTKDFYKKILIHREQKLPFYGPNDEFGTKGSITKANFKRSKELRKFKKENFLLHLTKLFSLPGNAGEQDE